jgi:hypothetical protein
MDRHTANSLDHWLTTPPEEYAPNIRELTFKVAVWVDADVSAADAQDMIRVGIAEAAGNPEAVRTIELIEGD